MVWFSRRPVVVQIPEERKENRMSLKPHDLLEHLESGNRMEVHLKNPVAPTSIPQPTMPSLQGWPGHGLISPPVLQSYERLFQQLSSLNLQSTQGLGNQSLQGLGNQSLQVPQNIGGIV